MKLSNTILALLVATFLAACSNDTTDNPAQFSQSGLEVVSDVSELPKCTKSNEGELVWVVNEITPRMCRDRKWFAVAEGKVTATCTTKELKDKSGVKIICGGDSIGVVLNGKDGADGKDGVDGKDGADGVDGKNGVDGKDGTDGTSGAQGAGCTMEKIDEISVRVTCGADSMVLYVGGSTNTTISDTTTKDSVVLDSEKVAVSLDEVSGVTQKGPFLSGSRVLIREMQDGRTLTQTGNSFNGKILNDRGEFKVKARMLVSQYVMLEASGYYRNEITGENSSSELTLFAITDVNERNTVNVNLLTHLEYERVIYLVTQKKMKVRDAKKQAQKEVFALLNIDATDFSNSEDLNIAGASDEDGALLAFSIIFQGDRSVSQLSELLQKIAIDMEEDGKWDNAAMRISLADWASQKELEGKMANIRQNVTGWQLSSIVPNFERHIHKFWTTEYGLGSCADENEGEVLQNTNEQSKTNGTYFICKSGKWTTASSIEFDTYQWEPGADGDVRSGDVVSSNCYVFENSAWRSGNASDCSLGLRGCTALRQDTVGKGSDKVWHICDAQSWRKATTYEKDTFGWKDSTDGAIKKGNVTDSIYVFDKTVWRATSNVEAKLGGCVSAIADSVGKVGSTYYICKSNSWVEASAIEYDTYHWTTGKDGDSKWGNVNTSSCYVFENSAWRSGNASDCSLGLRGCTALRQDTVGKGSDDAWYKCVSQTWRTATDIEKDTATWGAGEFDGEIRTGQVNETIYYIFETSNNAWRNAIALEYDTYDYANNSDWANGVDGEIRKGSITDVIYVFDATDWRVANDVEKVLGGCVSAIQDSLGLVNNIYYICKPRSWTVATELEYDTYRVICSEDGKMFNGNVNTTAKYVCDNGVFRATNELETEADSACTSYNRNKYYILPKYDGKHNYSYYKCTEDGWTFTTEKLNQGSMIDERDGHEYKTIGIKSQMWMAENLDYADSVNYPSMLCRNWCYENNLEYCMEYGRLYTWSAAIDSVTLYNNGSGVNCGFNKTCNLSSKIQGICPNRWRLPTQKDWQDLFGNINVSIPSPYGWAYSASKLLKSKTNWNDHDGGISGNGNDTYGFSALPSGRRSYTGSFDQIGFYVSFWSATEYSIKDAIFMSVNYSDDAYLAYENKGVAYSVRCVKDEEE